MRLEWPPPMSSLLVCGALACGGNGIAEPEAEPGPLIEGARLTLVSGDSQNAKVGEELLEPLAVRVTFAGGAPIERFQVFWELPGNRTTRRRTDANGIARLRYTPSELGFSTVSATATSFFGPLGGSPVSFSFETSTLVVRIITTPFPRCDDPDPRIRAPCGFLGPDDSNAVEVPVGTTIEWVKDVWGESTVTSVTLPPGGKGFESGTLLRHDRFRFVPEVPGTWEYVDRISGAMGTITAR